MAQLKEAAIGHDVANTALVTTAETEVIQSETVYIPSRNARILIHAHAQLTTGAATTTVTPRIRRGDTTGGTLVGEANAITIGAAAGSTEDFGLIVVDDVDNLDSVEYVFTLQQAGASANGSCLQAGILVLVL